MSKAGGRITHKPDCGYFEPPRRGLTINPCTCGARKPKRSTKFIPNETPVNCGVAGEGNSFAHHLWISDQTDRN
jgi:hypothetical protein